MGLSSKLDSSINGHQVSDLGQKITKRKLEYLQHKYMSHNLNVVCTPIYCGGWHNNHALVVPLLTSQRRLQIKHGHFLFANEFYYFFPMNATIMVNNLHFYYQFMHLLTYLLYSIK